MTRYEEDAFDGDANNSARLALARVISCGDAIAMTGSGVSAFLKYPGWRALLERLAEEAINSVGPIVDIDGLPVEIRSIVATLDPLLCAKYLRSALGNKYLELMRTIFGPREGDDRAMRILIELPFCHFFTTNYDPALELAHRTRRWEAHSLSIFGVGLNDFIGNLNNKVYARRILHVHGRYDEPENLVLTEDDYGRLYAANDLVRLLWENVAATRQLVFVGFSLADLDLLYAFRRTKHLLQGRARHFAILDLPDPNQGTTRRLELRDRYGIEPVFYKREGTDYSEYRRLLEEIQYFCRAAGRPAPVIVQPLELAAKVASVTLTAEVTETQQDENRLRKLTLESLERRQVGDLE